MQLKHNSYTKINSPSQVILKVMNSPVFFCQVKKSGLSLMRSIQETMVNAGTGFGLLVFGRLRSSLLKRGWKTILKTGSRGWGGDQNVLSKINCAEGKGEFFTFFCELR